MDAIEFTRNYSDLSTDRGFQFEFQCDRCGNGYKTTFQAWTMGSVSGALDAASSLFGGFFNEAANLSERARSAQWRQARDQALVQAINEIKPNFLQCPKCSSWVCKKNCWNQQRGLCKNCAPDLASAFTPFWAITSWGRSIWRGRRAGCAWPVFGWRGVNWA